MAESTLRTEIDEYVLGTDEGELARLGFQHRIWAAELEALWRQAGFRAGETILDVGCGPGFASLDLARQLTSNGRVIAVDQSERFITRIGEEAARRNLTNIEAHEMDVQELDLAEASIDGAFARWVLCFVPNPDAVIERVAKALKPGGAFGVMDYFNYLGITVGPKADVFTRVTQATDASWRQGGGDPDIGSRLPGLFEKHGLKVQSIQPIVRVARPGDPLWLWPETFFALFIPRLISMGLLNEDDHAAFNRHWEERSKDPTSTFYTPPIINIVGRKI